MTSPHVEAQLDVYLDGELTAIDAGEIEAHLAGCPECERFRDARLALRAAIREQLPTLRAPDTLRARVDKVVQSEAGLRAPRRGGVWRALAVAASLALVSLGSWRLPQRAAGQQLADQLLASHVRSLMPGPSPTCSVGPASARGSTADSISPAVYDYSGRASHSSGAVWITRAASGCRAGVPATPASDQRVVWPAAQGRGGPSEPHGGLPSLRRSTPQHVYWVVSDLGCRNYATSRRCFSKGIPQQHACVPDGELRQRASMRTG
jgi:anti-sigma factor (TIGR02949 family)